jgi:catechol 2,3-dioxygenase-like lactoylglutathione lyase family enzyme
MALKRMDNVGIVVDDLAATIDFFRELGLELESWVSSVTIRQRIGTRGTGDTLANQRPQDDDDWT